MILFELSLLFLFIVAKRFCLLVLSFSLFSSFLNLEFLFPLCFSFLFLFFLIFKILLFYILNLFDSKLGILEELRPAILSFNLSLIFNSLL